MLIFFNIVANANISSIFNIFRYYTIVGPSSIRANSEYHVSVSSHGIPTKSDIKLRIEGDKDYANSKDVSIDPFSTKLVQFKVMIINQIHPPT